MVEKKELKEEELEKVTGGYPGNSYEEYGFSGYVDRYAVKEGQRYFFVMLFGSIHYVLGEVTWTGEVDKTFGSVRTHKVNIIEDSHNYFGGRTTGDIYAGEWVAYTNYHGRAA